MRSAVLALLALAGYDKRPDQWAAFLYDESDDVSITEYTIEEL